MADSDLEALRQAKPSWMTNPQPEGSVDSQRWNVGSSRWDQPKNKRDERETIEFPPPLTSISQAAPAAAATPEEYSFELQLDTIDQANGQVDIHVGYGEINDTPPDGMTGADDYILTITDDGTEIYAIVTYDTSNLAITSRTLAFGASVPSNTYGTLYVPIGFVDITTSGGKITAVNPHNRQCGDINICFEYGIANGYPSLYTTVQLGNPVPLP